MLCIEDRERGGAMGRWILRFHSLVFRDDGENAAIYFDVEDDESIVTARATVRPRSDDAVDVEVTRGPLVDPDVLARVVGRLYAEKMQVLERIGAAVSRERCAVALGDVAVTVEGRRAVG